MMSDDSPLLDSDEEDLVAYLDGELPPEYASRIEQRLEVDPDLRKKLAELQESWQLLDCLPNVSADPKLAESTIELVALSLRDEAEHPVTSRFHRFRWLAFGLASICVFVLGISAAFLRDRWNQTRLLEMVPLLTRYSDLRLIDDPQWLQKLADVDALREAGLPLHREMGFPEPPQNVAELADWLNSLDPMLRLTLYENYQSFQSASTDRQIAIQEIDQLVRQENSPNYSEILRAYAGLVSQIGSAELAQIEADQDLSQRAEKIKQVVSREMAIAFASRLSESDRENIRKWANQLKENHFEYFVDVEDPDSEIVLMLDLPSSESVIQPEDIEELIERLSQTGRQLLAQLDEQQRMKALRLWVYSSLPSHRTRPQFTAKELQNKFRSLPLEQQNELIYLPGSEVIKKLSNDSLDSND